MKKLLTIAEAALAMNLSTNTVRGLCRARRIRHERHGLGRGTIRIPEDAIEEYRKGATVEAARERTRPPRRHAPRHLTLD